MKRRRINARYRENKVNPNRRHRIVEKREAICDVMTKIFEPLSELAELAFGEQEFHKLLKGVLAIEMVNGAGIEGVPDKQQIFRAVLESLIQYTAMAGTEGQNAA